MNDILLQSPRDVVSPREGKRWDTEAPVGPGDEGFEESVQQVKDAVRMAETGHWPAELLAIHNPTELEGKIPDLLRAELSLFGTRASRNLAMSVSMDKPWDLGVILLDKLLSEGVKYNTDRPGTIQFCDKDASYVRTVMRINQRVAAALDRVFDVKYFWKQPRPEDFMGIPGSVLTVDHHGAPGHWSYGAGHAAAASATDSVLQEDLALSPDQSQRTAHACWTFAFGRTPLGVHVIGDNKCGWDVNKAL